MYFGYGNGVIQNCKIHEVKGAGIYARGSYLRIDNCEIIDNESTNAGGGVSFNYGSGMVRNTTVANNTANQSGGGIKVYSSDVDIYSSSIKGNGVNSGVNEGGGLNVSHDSNVNVYRTIINDNSSGLKGSGIYLESNSSLALYNSNITNNTSASISSVHINGDCSMDIVNSIWWGNSSDILLNDSGSSLHISYSDIYGSQNSITNTSGGTIDWGAGNIDSDPLFVDLNSNFNLSDSSPCIDAGNPDLDGDNISWESDEDDSDPDGTRLDIGAYHYEQLDIIAPSVSLIRPQENTIFYTSQIDTIMWEAEDDKVLTWATLSISTDGGNNYTLIDTVSARDEFFLWAPEPDMVSNQARILTKVSDRGGNISSDESVFDFSILDGTSPSLVIESPHDGFEILENENIDILWDA